MVRIIYWIINMSITGSIVGCLLCLLRRLNLIPKTCFYYLWCIPFLRMILPVGLAGRFNLMELFSGTLVRSVPVRGQGDSLSVTASNYLKQAGNYFPSTELNPVWQKVLFIFGGIWLIGFISLSCVMLISYGAGKKEAKAAVRIYKCFYQVHTGTKAAVYGILHPCVLIPRELPQLERKYILMHEVVHLKRKDNLYRFVFLTITCMHWFNPCAWILLKRSLEDLELSCDEWVLRKLNRQEQKQYACTLLNRAEKASGISSPFGGANVRNRVYAIVSYRSMTLLSSVLVGIISILLVMLLMGNGRGSVI